MWLLYHLIKCSQISLWGNSAPFSHVTFSNILDLRLFFFFIFSWPVASDSRREWFSGCEVMCQTETSTLYKVSWSGGFFLARNLTCPFLDVSPARGWRQTSPTCLAVSAPVLTWPRRVSGAESTVSNRSFVFMCVRLLSFLTTVPSAPSCFFYIWISTKTWLKNFRFDI